jgi:hypothetical protein
VVYAAKGTSRRCGALLSPIGPGRRLLLRRFDR